MVTNNLQIICSLRACSVLVAILALVASSLASTVEAPADATIECGYPQAANIFGDVKLDGYSDLVQVTYTDTETTGCSNTKNVTRTWMVRDTDGVHAYVNQTIRIVDTLPPAIHGPSTMTLVCGERLWIGLRGFASAADRCDPAPKLTFIDGPETGQCVRTLVKSWTATDECGNVATWRQTIIRNVTRSPRLDKPPANVTVGCGQVTPAAAMLTAVDACDSLPLHVEVADETLVSPDTQWTHIVKRTWTTSDACNNVALAVQFIHYSCIESPPTAADVALHTEVLPLDDNATEQLKALVAADGTVPSWRTLDRSMRRQLLLHIGSQIKQSLLAAPLNLTIDCADSTDPHFTGEPLYSGDCDPELSFVDTVESDEASVISVKRNWTLTDSCGAAIYEVQSITMHDTLPPVVHLPPDIQIEAPQSADPINTGRAIAVDACDSQPIISYQDDEEIDACVDNRIILRKWTARDACGNTASAVQRIDVRDTTPPQLTAPDSVVVELNNPRVTELPTSRDRLASICLYMARAELHGVAVAKDNCDPNPTVERDTSTSLDLKTGTCNVTRVWHTRDRCGNMAASFEQLIAIQDTTAPVLVAPADLILTHTDPTDPAFHKFATAVDNGYAPTVTFSDDVAYGSNRNEKHIVRTWLATDASGNTAKALQNIVVQDTSAQGVAWPAREICLWPADGGFQCWSDVETSNVLVPTRPGFTNVTLQLLSCISSDAPKQNTADCVFANGRLCVVAGCSSAQDRVYTVRYKVTADGVAPASYMRNIRAACGCMDCATRCQPANNDRPLAGTGQPWRQPQPDKAEKMAAVNTPIKPDATVGADSVVVKTLVFGLLGLAAAIILMRVRTPKKVARRRSSGGH